ncbi:MAG: hypothetical protein GY787_14435 [Alteromonadales bacterium]|nr:hypothetical protein [Alteromonadales bacterium]
METINTLLYKRDNHYIYQEIEAKERRLKEEKNNLFQLKNRVKLNEDRIMIIESEIRELKE